MSPKAGIGTQSTSPASVQLGHQLCLLQSELAVRWSQELGPDAVMWDTGSLTDRLNITLDILI